MNNLLFVVALLFPFCCKSQTFDTYPVQNGDEDKIIVEANIGDTDVYAYCKITSANVSTTWDVDGETLDWDTVSFTATTTTGYEFKVDELIIRTNVSIIPSFMAEHDRLEVICRTGVLNQNNETFLFGIPVGPVLDVADDVYDVIEGEEFYLDLSNVSDVFPPYIVSEWTFNGTVMMPVIAQMINITLGDYNITVPVVFRDLAGVVIHLSVSNKIGSDDSGNFTLNVQYPPEAGEIYNNDTVYSEINRTVAIRAVNGSLSGNPYPDITWVHPNETIDLSHPRFDISSTGVLTISSIKPIDFGGYIFIASNGIGDPLMVDITLIEAVKPGKPTNITITDTESGINFVFITVTWNPPDELGIPAFTNEYIVSIILQDMIIKAMNTNVTETDFLFDSLLPGTTYKVSVKAVSEYFVDGGEPGFTEFTTDRSLVDIDTVTAVNIDGNIKISYKLNHAGGFDHKNISIQVFCDQQYIEEGSSSMSSGNTDEPEPEILYLCLSNCLNEDLSGSQIVSGTPLDAGDTYYCLLIAENVIGETYFFEIPPINITIGLPSDPEVSITSEEDKLIISLRVEHPGVDINNDSDYLELYILIQRTIDSVYVYNATSQISGCKRICSLVRNITLEETGEYIMFVAVVNKYGVSETIQLNYTLNFNRTTENTGSNTGAIIAASVGGAVGIIIIVVMIGAVIVGVAIHSKQTKAGKVQPIGKDDEVLLDKKIPPSEIIPSEITQTETTNL